jgi:hypothetical protein
MFPRQATMFQRIATLTGIDISDVYASSNHRFAEVLTPLGQAIELEEITEGNPVPLLAHSLAAKQLRPANAGQFCPACLREAVYHRLVWMPLAVSACLKHRCLLVNRCQRCSRAVSIQDIVETRCCQCGDQLAETEVIPLENDVGLPFQHILQSWLMESVTPDRLHLLPQESPRILYRVVDGLQWATRMLEGSEWPYLHRIHTGPSRVKINGQWALTPDANYCLFATASKGIMNWPQGFYQFLDAYRSQMHREKSPHGGPKADLGNLYTQWLQDYWRHPAFEFVHSAFEQYFIRSYSLSSAVARSNLCQERPDVIEQFSLVNIAEAARLLETTPTMIKILLRTGRLTYQTQGSASKRMYRFVSRMEVLKLRSVWNELVNRAYAAEWLGVTERMVVDLVNVGLLSAEHCPAEGYPSWAFSRAALHQCLDSVSRHVEVYPHREGDNRDSMVNLAGAARLLFVVGLNAVSILFNVAEGRLRACQIARQELKLGSLLFDSSDIEQYIHKIKSENSWVSREEVIELLKVKDVTLTRWVRTRLISPTTVHGSAQYFGQDTVEMFIADHVITEEAAKILGVGKLTIQKWARQGKLFKACVSGPNIDGHHGYIFHRERLIQWHEDNIRLSKQ